MDLFEKSLTTTYKKSIRRPFIRAIQQYELIQENDRIAVCISGGKDSMLLAKLMQILARYSKIPFEVVNLSMDPGYSPANRKQIEYNASLLGLQVEFFDSPIFEVTDQIKGNPCYLCARMRRGYLYSKAQELGCNKIALGHHFSDVIETTLMGMLYGAQLQGMMPKLHSTNFPGMELIRPLYQVHEDDIISWRDHHKLQFLACACRVTERLELTGDTQESKRQETKVLIKKLKETNPHIETNIFHSLHNLHLDTFPEWKSAGKRMNFLDFYDQKSNDLTE